MTLEGLQMWMDKGQQIKFEHRYFAQKNSNDRTENPVAELTFGNVYLAHLGAPLLAILLKSQSYLQVRLFSKRNKITIRKSVCRQIHSLFLDPKYLHEIELLRVFCALFNESVSRLILNKGFRVYYKMPKIIL